MSEAEITLEQMIAEVGRELAMRRSAYPRFVANHKLIQQDADKQIARMEAVRDLLRRLPEVVSVLELFKTMYRQPGDRPNDIEAAGLSMKVDEVLAWLKKNRAPQGALDLVEGVLNRPDMGGKV